MRGDDTSTLDADQLFDLLCNSRRLYLLEYLHRQREPSQLTDAATYIAARENEKSPDDLTEDERRRAYISLYQTHLPLLTEQRVVDWDGETNEIQLTGRTQLEPYLDVDGSRRRRWDYYYALVAVLGLFTASLAIPGVYPFSLVPIAGYVFLVSGLTFVLAVYQLGRQRLRQQSPRSRPTE